MICFAKKAFKKRTAKKASWDCRDGERYIPTPEQIAVACAEIRAKNAAAMVAKGGSFGRQPASEGMIACRPVSEDALCGRLRLR